MLFRNRQKAIRVADVLHGCTPGRIQSVFEIIVDLFRDLVDQARQVKDTISTFTC